VPQVVRYLRLGDRRILFVDYKSMNERHFRVSQFDLSLVEHCVEYLAVISSRE